MGNVFDIHALTESSKVYNIFERSSIEETYFYSALNFVHECNNEIRNNTKVLYKSIMESADNQEVITESFNSFFDKIKEIIKKFINFIKSLVERFIIALHKFISSDKYLIKHKNDFKDFKSAYEFDIQGYNYSFDSEVPVIKVVEEFRRDFIDLNFDDMLKKNDSNEMIKFISDKVIKLNKDLNENDYYDRIRGKVIGESKAISSSDFHEECFAKFREDSSSKESITITTEKVNVSLARFSNYKDTEKETRKTKDRIEKEYKEIEKLIKSMVSRTSNGELKGLLMDGNGNYSGGDKDISSIPKEAERKIDLFIKNKATQITKISSIHSLAFSLKLDALTECYKQDKQILYKALSKIKKESYKEGK